jgi:hypothetical protein
VAAHVLLLCKKGASKDCSVHPDGDSELHVVFAIPRNQFQDWGRRLAEHGVSSEHPRLAPGRADKASIFATLPATWRACNAWCGACTD